MKILAITQARIASTRLPEKVLFPLGNETVLDSHLRRIKRSQLLTDFVVATTRESKSEEIIKIAQRNNFKVFQGSTDDVLDRFYQAAKDIHPDFVVRLTSDCPLIDPACIDELIQQFLADRKSNPKLEYGSNCEVPTYPDGMDAEIFTFSSLEIAWKEATKKSEREHVTPYIRAHFPKMSLRSNKDFSHFRLTLDTERDYLALQKLVNLAEPNSGMYDYIRILGEFPEIIEINKDIQRNEGYAKSLKEDGGNMLRKITHFKKSDEYRAKIHGLIPGGSHTYTKGDDQFPLRAPAAITHGKGAYVWDPDGNQFLDCSMGLTSVILGHAYEPVLEKVREELSRGVNFQRPSVIEMTMAEEFLKLVPKHHMIKFAKNGSTATTAAVKLARAFTGRNMVVFPGDHPFYSYDDWFIGRTNCDRGVPEAFKGLTTTYNSMDLGTLENVFSEHPGKIACVISEPEKNFIQEADYLKKLIEICHKHGALFIQDEMITGFKTDFPGSIKKYNVEPDLATWGKGIANGFSFCALTGKREIMELGGITSGGAEKVFLVSTTHGGETHSMAAALATIDIFKKQNVIGHNQGLGQLMIKGVNEAISRAGLSEFVAVSATDWMQAFTFKNKKKEVCPGMRTLFMQEMIARGVLFQGAFVPCFSHTQEDIGYFHESFIDSLKVYSSALESGYEKFLVGPPTKPVFRKFI